MAEHSTPDPIASAPAAGSGPPEASAAKDRGRTFPCEACGGELVFHVGMQSLQCPFCGHVKTTSTDPGEAVEEQDFREMVRRLAELRDGARADERGFHEIRCDGCGGTMRFSGTLTSGECAYCGIPLQLENAHDAPHRVPADGVLPFAIDRAKARANLRTWINSRWLAPNALRRSDLHSRLAGVYLPYWTFDSLTTTRYSGMRGDHYYVNVGSGKKRRRVRKVRWTPTSGSFQRLFDDVLVAASTGLPPKRLAQLEPWPLDRCVPYNPEILAGFLSRTYDVELEEGFTRARSSIDAALHRETRRRIGGDTQRVTSIHSTYDALTYKHLLLPVWLLAYRFRDKVYQVAVNAGTGEIQGDRPYSAIKVGLLVAAGLLAAAALALLVSR